MDWDGFSGCDLLRFLSIPKHLCVSSEIVAGMLKTYPSVESLQALTVIVATATEVSSYFGLSM